MQNLNSSVATDRLVPNQQHNFLVTKGSEASYGTKTLSNVPSLPYPHPTKQDLHEMIMAK